jgi:hypothetical protein
MKRTIDLLAASDTYLEWVEPWPSLDKNGSGIDAHVILKATVKDCIAIQRNKVPCTSKMTESDADLLLDFIAIHWAKVLN